ncbi:MAG: hypothetical protein ACLP7Q_25335 [Isosphaeraceae bacterium]
MKRYLMTLVLSGLVGSLVLASNAEACHKKKSTCAPAPVCAAPCPPPAPVCEPVCAPACPPPAKKCGLFSGFKGFGCHKKACAPAPVCEWAPAPPCETVAYSAPVIYAAPVLSSPQASYQH